MSTDDQDTAAQVTALHAVGCARIYREKGVWRRWNRPDLLQLLTHLRPGDIVVVWKLDRLSRSLRDVLTLLEQFGEAGAGFRSVTEAVDTTPPAGQMMMPMVGGFAEFERAMLRERPGPESRPPGRKVVWGAAAPSSPRNSNPRFKRWWWKARRRGAPPGVAPQEDRTVRKHLQNTA